MPKYQFLTLAVVLAGVIMLSHCAGAVTIANFNRAAWNKQCQQLSVQLNLKNPDCTLVIQPDSNGNINAADCYCSYDELVNNNLQNKTAKYPIYSSSPVAVNSTDANLNIKIQPTEVLVDSQNQPLGLLKTGLYIIGGKNILYLSTAKQFKIVASLSDLTTLKKTYRFRQSAVWNPKLVQLYNAKIAALKNRSQGRLVTYSSEDLGIIQSGIIYLANQAAAGKLQ